MTSSMYWLKHSLLGTCKWWYFALLKQAQRCCCVSGFLKLGFSSCWRLNYSSSLAPFARRAHFSRGWQSTAARFTGENDREGTSHQNNPVRITLTRLLQGGAVSQSVELSRKVVVKKAGQILMFTSLTRMSAHVHSQLGPSLGRHNIGR